MKLCLEEREKRKENGMEWIFSSRLLIVGLFSLRILSDECQMIGKQNYLSIYRCVFSEGKILFFLTNHHRTDCVLNMDNDMICVQLISKYSIEFVVDVEGELMVVASFE